MRKAVAAIVLAFILATACPSWSFAYVPPTSPCGPGAGNDCPPPRDGLA